MPGELAQQWGRVGELMRALGFTFSESEELEADDAMGSYAWCEQDAGGRAVLLTADRDLYQVVNEDVAILEMKGRGEHGAIGPEQVRERYGVEPAQVPDFIALRGDPSDGLPGAPGVGARTAAEILRAHGTLEQALEDARSIRTAMRPRVAAALRENAAQLLDFKQIATLVRTDVERPASVPVDTEAGAEVARSFGMNGLARRLGQLRV
jgi:DNA polymerase-1